MEKIKNIIRNNIPLIAIGAGIIALVVIIMIVLSKKEPVEEEIITYDYTEEEQFLADNEKAFIETYLELTENQKGKIANDAVEIYRVIINSDTDLINEKHSNTIKTRLRHAIIESYDYAEELTDEELNALSSGMTEIIYEMLLSEVTKLEGESNVSYEELQLLSLSLQDQIDDLSSQKANIKIHIRTELDGETLMSGFENLSEEELKELATKLGFKDSNSMVNAYKNNELSKSDLDSIENELKKSLEKDIDKKIQDKTKNLNGKDGKDGKDGVNGKNGRDGSDGKDGKSAYELAKSNGYMGSEKQYLESLSGEDGLTTYIAYADDENGKNFSLTPTNTTKYIGSCMSSATTYPTDPKAYTWSEFKDYIITYDPESNTVIITN